MLVKQLGSQELCPLYALCAQLQFPKLLVLLGMLRAPLQLLMIGEAERLFVPLLSLERFPLAKEVLAVLARLP